MLVRAREAEEVGVEFQLVKDGEIVVSEILEQVKDLERFLEDHDVSQFATFDYVCGSHAVSIELP